MKVSIIAVIIAAVHLLAMAAMKYITQNNGNHILSYKNHNITSVALLEPKLAELMSQELYGMFYLFLW